MLTAEQRGQYERAGLSPKEIEDTDHGDTIQRTHAAATVLYEMTAHGNLSAIAEGLQGDHLAMEKLVRALALAILASATPHTACEHPYQRDRGVWPHPFHASFTCDTIRAAEVLLHQPVV